VVAIYVYAGYYVQSNKLKTLWSSEMESCLVWHVVNISNEHAASIFSAEIFYPEKWISRTQ
jgi:NCAIR mutase (PurE)-related protein